MVDASVVDKKISDSKKVLKRKLSAVDKKASASKKIIKRALKKQSVKNIAQDSEIAKLKATVEKLKKKKSSSRHVSEYNLFVRKQIKSGLSFTRAAKEWNKYKALQKKRGRRLSAYNQFIGSQMRLGKTFIQSIALWKLAKSGKLGKKGSTRTVTKTILRKSKPKLIKKIITRTHFNEQNGFNSAQFKQILESSHVVSKSDLKEAFAPNDEEIAFKILQTYFIEIARLGFKRRLSLDEIIDAYFYALNRVRSHGENFDDIEAAVRAMEEKK